MRAILTQEEARKLWVSMDAMKCYPFFKVVLRSALDGGDSTIAIQDGGKIRILACENYLVVAREDYPSSLAMATRYAIAR